MRTGWSYDSDDDGQLDRVYFDTDKDMKLEKKDDEVMDEDFSQDTVLTDVQNLFLNQFLKDIIADTKEVLAKSSNGSAQ